MNNKTWDIFISNKLTKVKILHGLESRQIAGNTIVPCEIISNGEIVFVNKTLLTN